MAPEAKAACSRYFPRKPLVFMALCQAAPRNMLVRGAALLDWENRNVFLRPGGSIRHNRPHSHRGITRGRAP